MPQFQLFGRKWFFASDDLPFAAVCGAVFHGVWALVLTFAASVDRPDDCNRHLGVDLCLYGLIASFFVSVVMDSLIASVGLRGTIFESGKRKASGVVLYFQMANFGLKIALAAYGTRLVFSKPPACLRDSGTFEQVMKAVIISTWVIIGIFLLLGIATWRRRSSTNTLATWEKRVRCLNLWCCGGLNQDRDTLAQAAWVFADFFKPMDFTPMDTITAMVLAAHKQRFQRMMGSAGHNKSKTWMGHRRSAERDKKSHLQILENEEQMSGSMDSRPITTPVRNVDMKSGGVSGHIGGTGEELGASLSIEREHIEIVVETHEENGYNVDAREDNSPTSLPLAISNQKAERRKRNLAVDLSALNFSAGIEGMVDEYYPDFTSHPNGQNLNGKSSQFSGESNVTSMQKFPQNIAESHNQVTGSLGRKVSDDHDGTSKSSDHLQMGGEQGSTTLDAILSSGSSVKTTLTWGDSFTGPFLTPPGGDRSLGVSSGDVPLEVLKKFLKYHRYANAVYGALLYVAAGRSLLSLPLRCCSLCIRATPPNAIRRNIRYMRPTRKKSNPLLEDVNIMRRLDNEAILRWGVNGEDIIYRSYANTIAGHLPYFIALDREDRAIVVAIRGTSSWTDLVTDFLIHPEPLSDQELEEIEGILQEVRGGTVREGLPEVDRASVHKGILGAARALVKDLEDCGILDILESRSQGNFIIDENIAGWQLILTGHSLGAGVGSLASLLLRKRFIDVHCYAVSPPGGLMSPELANAMAPFCTSLLHGKDMIPRLGVGPTERLRDQMVLSAAQSKRNKAQILLGALSRKKWTEDELFHKVDSMSNEALTAYQLYKSSTDRESNSDSLCQARKFVAPGKIVFLRPQKEKLGESEQITRTFQAVWTSGGEIAKEGILMSAHMFTDHFPFLSIDSLEASIRARAVEARRNTGGHSRPSGSSIE